MSPTAVTAQLAPMAISTHPIRLRGWLWMSNAPTSGKVFWDCYTGYQGIQSGWVDQYHHATHGQQVDLTGVPNGTNYYLVSTTSPTGAFLEQDKTNNTAWVKFTLSTDSSGNRKVTVTDHSPCESPGMCGELSPNR